MALCNSRTGKKLEIDSLSAILEGKIGSGLVIKDPLPKPFSETELKELEKLSFADLAAKVIGRFFEDVDQNKITKFCKKAYSKSNFDTNQIAPVVRVGNNFHLEQWHGKTAAFKDIALSLLPLFMQEALKREKNIKKALILGATSGDTGSAGEAGFYDIKNVYVSILYPEKGKVTEVQKRQMIDFQTDDGRISAYSIIDNFDYCQSNIAKPLLNDDKFRQELLEKYNCKLTSLNSINIGRLAPQIVSFFWSYFQIKKPFEIVIPTGNFGHALSAYFAKKMGVPIKKIIIANNENDVLTRFINTGIFKPAKFKTTNSPSMDINIPSNLERLLYYVAGSENNSNWMNDLKTKGSFEIDKKTHAKIKEDFEAYSINEKDTLEEISNIWKNYKRIIDPHTAVGSKVASNLENNNTKLILETAHWGKFVQTIFDALEIKNEDKNEFAGMKKINKLIEKESGKPGLTEYLLNLHQSNKKPKKANFKPNTEQMKKLLIKQISS